MTRLLSGRVLSPLMALGLILIWSQLLLLINGQIISVDVYGDSDSTESYSPSWKCENSKCEREYGILVSNSDQALKICRLNCGRGGSIWPKPTGETRLGSQVVDFHPLSIRFQHSGNYSKETETFIESIQYLFVKKLTKLCGQNCKGTPPTEVNLTINVAQNGTILGYDTQEDYYLQSSILENEDSKVLLKTEITATTVYGVRHALETLYQLTAKSISNTYLVQVGDVTIKDFPAFKHRGVVLDTSRHFIPLVDIKRQLDAMSMNKMNVFHWHISDTHSFPLQLDVVPQLSRYGAYSKSKIYTSEDVQYLVLYAKLRGIRIILELDAPAHAGNGWQWGPKYNLGDLVVCLNVEPWRQNCIQPPCGQLNPINPNVYTVLKEVYTEMMSLTGFEYSNHLFHMGADEVYVKCWNNTPAIVDFMKAHGKDLTLDDYTQLWAHFQNKAAASFDEGVGHNKTKFIIWSSHLTNPLLIENFLNKDRYIIQTWVPKIDPLADLLIAKGYQVIISTKDAWYLDHGFWGVTSYYRWQHVYDNLLPNSDLVLGGEVALWTEYVDEQTLDARLWPRAAAAAERLWTNSETPSRFAETRFIEQRERLVQIGIRAEITTPEWCYENDSKCS